MTEAALLFFFLRFLAAGEVWLRKDANGCWVSLSLLACCCLRKLRDLRGAFREVEDGLGMLEKECELGEAWVDLDGLRLKGLRQEKRLKLE